MADPVCGVELFYCGHVLLVEDLLIHSALKRLVLFRHERCHPFPFGYLLSLRPSSALRRQAVESADSRQVGSESLKPSMPRRSFRISVFACHYRLGNSVIGGVGEGVMCVGREESPNNPLSDGDYQ